MPGQLGLTLHLGHLLAYSDPLCGTDGAPDTSLEGSCLVALRLRLGARRTSRCIESAIANRQRRIADVSWDQA
jgi:hypothetical protein